MALPLVTDVAGTAALAAYLNAKYHIAHDLRTGKGSIYPTQADFKWMGQRLSQHKLLNWHIFEEQAQKQPNHPFLIFEGQQWTYDQFLVGTRRVANWLIQELGVEVGEIVALDGGNSPEHVMIWLALDAVGGVTSFINNNISGDGLAHCVKLCEPRYLLADSDVRDNVELVRATLEEAGIEIKYYNPSFISSLSDGTNIPASRYESISLATPRELIYTSGTTGHPKGVVIEAAKELFTPRGVARYLRLTPSDRIYTCMPLYHAAGHSLCLTPAIHVGATLVLSRKFSHSKFWPEVAQSQATIIQYVGELGRYLVNGPRNEYERKHCVRMAWGNGMRPDVWEPFRKRFNIPIINELYAATDGMASLFNWNEGDFTKGALGMRGAIWNWKYGGEEVRVKMDIDTEDIMRDANGFAIRCGADEPGQVLIKLDPKAPAHPGYYNNNAATEKRRIRDVFRKGDLWFKSGDMMRQDADGRVYFVDRLGDTFRWKSENVSTHEVADALGKHPQIAEANVYGISVPGYDGRAGMATVVLADGVTLSSLDLKGLAEHAKARLPGYAVPLFLRVTQALEYTGNLKMQKGTLKREGADPDLISGEDKLYCLPLGSDRYVPFGKENWEGIKTKRLRLT
ncbi:long-chain fatty acid transporter-like protein [Bimuria novae-zelandiae CBS 107.79]|uniref:Very long-chain fatty acid transport protein n=1 Tax=Bimuria novae-zelandiae CBS 107.79 TaxID=1447943 RepID=A0A6A5UKS4_9PLEO|nr:long-chain fatty acid transporter-like protein [Bimuria novae-zelandiae CBS 107.79]